MFKTGRTDCVASSAANKFQQYITNQKEDHPDVNGNGPMTVDYYNRTFGFTGKEGLVLMGIHAIGTYDPSKYILSTPDISTKYIEIFIRLLWKYLCLGEGREAVQ